MLLHSTEAWDPSPSAESYFSLHSSLPCIYFIKILCYFVINPRFIMGFKKELFPFKWLTSTVWPVLSLGLFLFSRLWIQKPKYTSLDRLANSFGRTVFCVEGLCSCVGFVFQWIKLARGSIRVRPVLSLASTKLSTGLSNLKPKFVPVKKSSRRKKNLEQLNQNIS